MKSQFCQHTKCFLSAFRSVFVFTYNLTSHHSCSISFYSIPFQISFCTWPAQPHSSHPKWGIQCCTCVHTYGVSRAIVNQIAKIKSGTDFLVNVNLIQMNSQPFYAELWRRSMIVWITFLGIIAYGIVCMVCWTSLPHTAHPSHSLRSMSFKKFHRTGEKISFNISRNTHWLCTNLPLSI